MSRELISGIFLRLMLLSFVGVAAFMFIWPHKTECGMLMCVVAFINTIVYYLTSKVKRDEK